MGTSRARRALLVLGVSGALLSAAEAQSKWVRHYHERVASFREENAKLALGARYVVLVGDSLMEGWRYRKRVAKYLPRVGAKVLNRGITADGLSAKRGLLARLDASIFDCQPERVFILIGVNDLGRDGSGLRRVEERYAALVGKVRERRPECPLVLVTCSPVGRAYRPMNPHIVKLNDHIRALAKARGCALLDLHSLLADASGALPESMSRDGLHFGDQGYALFGRAIEALCVVRKGR